MIFIFISGLYQSKFRGIRRQYFQRLSEETPKQSTEVFFKSVNNFKKFFVRRE